MYSQFRDCSTINQIIIGYSILIQQSFISFSEFFIFNLTVISSQLR